MPRLPVHLAQLLFRPAALAALPARALAATRSSLPTAFGPTLAPRLAAPSTLLSRGTGPGPSPILSLVQQARFIARGAEYQPSQRKRKRKHGFLARKKSLGGRKILARRMLKKRTFLSH